MEKVTKEFEADLFKISEMYKVRSSLAKSIIMVDDIIYKVNSRYKKIQNKYNLIRKHFIELGLEDSYVMRESWDYFFAEKVDEETVSLHIYYLQDSYNDSSDWSILVGLTDKRQKELFKLFEAECKSIKDKTSSVDTFKIQDEINKLEIELSLKKAKLNILKTETETEIEIK